MNDLAALTPHARVDLDAVERNVHRMQAYCDTHRLACRPHIKTHKLPWVAHLQVEAGAVGVTCQKLGEAEVMVAAGIKDVLLSYPLLGAPNVERLARLARVARMGVALDSAVVADGLSAGLAASGVEVEALVEVDTGLGRSGVQSAAEAVALARHVAGLPGLRFGGLLTYPTPPDAALLRAAREAIEAAGLPVARISGGGTQQAFRTHEIGEVTEVRVGTYALGDRACIAHGSVGLEDCALRIHATVVSRPAPGRAILDAGMKALTSDPVEADGVGGYGLIVERQGATISTLYEEHARVELDPDEPDLALGDVVTIIPNHACGAMNLHDEVVVHRGGDIVGAWHVAARGAIR